MNIQRFFLKIAIFPLIIIGLISCNPLTGAITLLNNPDTVMEIKKQAPNASISFTATVANIAPFLKGGAYQLQDNTGNIWVITQETLPPVGEEIRLKALVQEKKIMVEDQVFSEYYLQELSSTPQLNQQSIQRMFFPHQ
jgi:hypothetical protein